MSDTSDRAKQFMPFAALRGYYGLIAERNRITEPRRELSEEASAELSDKLRSLEKGQLVSVTYYDRDAYITLEGAVAGIDPVFRVLTVVKTRIPMDDIWDVVPEN